MSAQSSLATDDGYVPTFDETDLAFIQEYADDHYQVIKRMVDNGLWEPFMFRTILTDFLTGVLVNANPQDDR